MPAFTVYLGSLSKLFGLFDFDQNKQRDVVRTWTAFFVFGAITISCVFLGRAVYEAGTHPLWTQERVWTDEHNGMAARTAPYLQLIKGDIASQASRAPLDYIAQKAFDQVALSLLSKGVPESIYYRLNSMFYSLFSGLFIVLYVFAAIRKQVRNYLVLLIQMSFLLMALLIYYFWPGNFSFSIQMRPYALWNSLWFMVLGLFLVRGRLEVWPFTVLFALMAATANAAIWQLFAFMTAFMLVRLLRKYNFVESVKTLFKVFIIPVAVSLYYILIDLGGYGLEAKFNQYLKEFFDFWLAKEMIPVLSLLGILITGWFEELKHHAIAFLAMLILYLISPLINYLVISRGVFFSSRHYIYYDLIYPVFLLSMAMALPVFLEKIRQSSQR